MTTQELVKKWFESWEQGDFQNIPISDEFKHTSPYGTFEGKLEYLDLVRSNKDKFLGHRFEIHDELHGQNKACVRYTVLSEGFQLDVSEWFYINGGLIQEIIAYYNIEGDISEERTLEMPDE